MVSSVIPYVQVRDVKLLNCVWFGLDLRGSLGCVGVFPLAASLSEAFGRDVVAHLPVVTHLVGLRHVLETLLITGRQSLKSHDMVSGQDS